MYKLSKDNLIIWKVFLPFLTVLFHVFLLCVNIYSFNIIFFIIYCSVFAGHFLLFKIHLYFRIKDVYFLPAENCIQVDEQKYLLKEVGRIKRYPLYLTRIDLENNGSVYFIIGSAENIQILTKPQD